VYSEYDATDYQLTLGISDGSNGGSSSDRTGTGTGTSRVNSSVSSSKAVRPPPGAFVLVVNVPEDQDPEYMPSDVMELMSQIYDLGPALIMFAAPAANASTYYDADNYPLINGALLRWGTCLLRLLIMHLAMHHASRHSMHACLRRHCTSLVAMFVLACSTRSPECITSL
jgi:hypothetical protein